MSIAKSTVRGLAIALLECCESYEAAMPTLAEEEGEDEAAAEMKRIDAWKRRANTVLAKLRNAPQVNRGIQNAE